MKQVAGAGALLVRNAGVVTRRIGAETVLVPVRHHVDQLDTVYTLNETGSLVWDLMDGSRTVAQVIAALVCSFEVSATRAAEDVARVVEDLCAEGLLRAVPGQDGP